MLESVWERLRAFGCKQTEHILYWISIWCVLGVGLVYIAAFYIAHVTGNDRLLQCKMKLYLESPARAVVEQEQYGLCYMEEYCRQYITMHLRYMVQYGIYCFLSVRLCSVWRLVLTGRSTE